MEQKSLYEMWGLAKEVTSWGFDLPSADEIIAALLAAEPIEWNRIGAFQDVTMRLIAERILAEQTSGGQTKTKGGKSDKDKGVYVQGELANQRHWCCLPQAGRIQRLLLPAQPGLA